MAQLTLLLFRRCFSFLRPNSDMSNQIVTRHALHEGLRFAGAASTSTKSSKLLKSARGHSPVNVIVIKTESRTLLAVRLKHSQSLVF